MDELVVEDFYTSKNQQVFSTIKELHFFKEPIELGTVARKIMDAGKIEVIGGVSALSNMIDNAPMSQDLSYHLKVIKEKRALRQAIEVSNAVLKRALSDEPATETIEFFHKHANKIEIESTSGDFKTMQEMAEQNAEQVEEVMANRGVLRGAPTGYPDMDKLTNGMQAGNLIVIAARPSMGKTALAMNIAKHQAKKGVPVGIFSLEQPANELFNRMAADEASIDTMSFQTGNFSADELKTLNFVQGKLWELPLWVDDSGFVTIEEICSRTRRYARRNQLRVLYIDHLQLIYSTAKFQSRNDMLGYVTSRLKGLAKELNITVVLLSQLNRQLENRTNPDKRPRLSDLRDSGNIEQDSDIVMFIYRPGAYKDLDSEKWPGHSHLIFGKNRNGPTGTIDVTWEKQYTRFRSAELRYGTDEFPLG